VQWLRMIQLTRSKHCKPVVDLPVPDVWYQQPLYYKGNRFCVAPSGKDIVWPAYSEVMDFELELACIIGKKGKDISHANAEDHIFGYTIYNDFSARDTQMQESAGPLGPA
jgi:2-keto-4-pentenoate hydratase/2-oxohepta-3-ene-1,7-dioic acid hydratase in catechol pathway